MEMNHFSHEEHPLILNQVPHKNGHDEKVVICYGCQEEIREGEESYSCLPCHYFLHKRCAELPKEITHRMHSIHPLILLKRPPYHAATCICNACCLEDWRYFTYHCSLCSFDLHLPCAVLDPDFKHESHDHSLIPQPRPATFLCNACCAEDKDSSYMCSICPFWIHKTCASLPKTMYYKDHDHTLSLTYSIPLEHRNFPKYCSFCHKHTRLDDWCYHCGPCRYFIHLKCLLSNNKSTEGIDKPMSDGQSNCEQNLVKLPSPQAAQELIKHSLLAAGNESEMMQIGKKIHRHPLTRCSINMHTQLNESWIIGKEIICDRCIEPIYDTEVYDSSVDCGYFIHATCARLPREIQILNHPQHPLLLSKASNNVGRFTCKGCNRVSNGFFYGCQPCNLFVCVKCISVALTETLAHDAHGKHQLTNQAEKSNPNKCNACGFVTPAGFGFGCDKCQFYLCSECALLPPSTTQRWYDKHPLVLIYNAYYEHPDDFYCVMCEEEINPNHWMYHCPIRDTSFHVWCIPQIRLSRNLKFGRTLLVGNHHLHPLTHVPEAKYKSFCKDCSKRLDWEEAFECDEPCKFYLCPSCASWKELSTDDDDSPKSDEVKR